MISPWQGSKSNTKRDKPNRQGDEPTAAKRARKYNNKIWRTDGGERDPHRVFIEYVGHRPKGDNVPGNFYMSPVQLTSSPIIFLMIRRLLETQQSSTNISRVTIFVDFRS